MQLQYWEWFSEWFWRPSKSPGINLQHRTGWCSSRFSQGEKKKGSGASSGKKFLQFAKMTNSSVWYNIMKLFLCRSFLKKRALTWRKKIMQSASWRSLCNMKKKKMLMQIASWRRGRQHEEEIAHANCIMKKLMATWRRRRSCKVLHDASVPPFGPNSSPTNSPDWISRFCTLRFLWDKAEKERKKTWWEKIGGSLVPEEEWS